MEQLEPEVALNGEKAKIELAGVEGQYHWPIRIASFLMFVATLLINYFVGLQTGAISDTYHLYVTPPGLFFSIWAVIYTSLAAICIYNLIKNEWSIKVHIAFAASNILNLMWILVFNIGSNPAVYGSTIILFGLIPAILLTWIEMGKIYMARADKEVPWKGYIMRNVFAFYLGWVIAATNLNLGMDIVFWWGATKTTQLTIFWVMAPCCAVGAFVFNGVREGKNGLLSCCCLWLSVAWAFTGASITSSGCLNNTLTLC